MPDSSSGRIEDFHSSDKSSILLSGTNLNTCQCSKAGDRVSKTPWAGSIPAVRANLNGCIVYEWIRIGHSQCSELGSTPSAATNFPIDKLFNWW